MTLYVQVSGVRGDIDLELLYEEATNIYPGEGFDFTGSIYNERLGKFGVNVDFEDGDSYVGGHLNQVQEGLA